MIEAPPIFLVKSLPNLFLSSFLLSSDADRALQKNTKLDPAPSKIAKLNKI